MMLPDIETAAETMTNTWFRNGALTQVNQRLYCQEAVEFRCKSFIRMQTKRNLPLLQRNSR